MNAIQYELFDASTYVTQPPQPTIEERIQSVLECLDSIPFINHGGCGISALAFYRWCKKNGVRVCDRPFVFLWDRHDEWEARHNDELLQNGELDRVEVPSHIVIRLDDGLYDSTGITNYVETGYWPNQQEYDLNEEELLVIINRPSDWNPTFRRSKHIEKIEFGLDVDLSDVIQ